METWVRSLRESEEVLAGWGRALSKPVSGAQEPTWGLKTCFLFYKAQLQNPFVSVLQKDISSSCTGARSQA